MRSQAHNEGTSPLNTDIPSFEELLTTYGKPLTSFAYSYLKDWGLAEDIVQEVFVSVYKNLDTFEGRSSVKTWIYSIAANKCKDYLRKNYFKYTSLVKFIPKSLLATKETPEELVLTRTANQELAAKIMELPVKYREVIILYYYEDLSLSEAAKLLEMNVSTVKTRIQRARKLLEGQLKGGEFNGI
ncbi:sigma-70 family RNA polymerase sigma factor [Bacillus timonensis]|nr:sigma-70 family RNA polymerase sigma factor [Bacillus timonensis]